MAGRGLRIACPGTVALATEPRPAGGGPGHWPPPRRHLFKFHFKKDHVAYSIAPEDYDKDLPLFVAIKENRLLNEFFLFDLEDLHIIQGLGALKFTSDRMARP